MGACCVVGIWNLPSRYPFTLPAVVGTDFSLRLYPFSIPSPFALKEETMTHSYPVSIITPQISSQRITSAKLVESEQISGFLQDLLKTHTHTFSFFSLLNLNQSGCKLKLSESTCPTRRKPIQIQRKQKSSFEQEHERPWGFLTLNSGSSRAWS